jgi:membrane protein DedA with SNARE-associated domain
VTHLVRTLGPLGVFLLMVPESACLPVPSEVTLLFAGFSVTQGWMDLPTAVVAATAGNLTGSLIAYAAGRMGALQHMPLGRGAVLLRCERLFERHGDQAVLLARLLPLARTFVSLPAGHARVGLPRFVLLTTVGCAAWAFGLVLAGDVAGSAWQVAGDWIAKASLLAVAACMAAWAIRPSAPRS